MIAAVCCGPPRRRATCCSGRSRCCSASRLIIVGQAAEIERTQSFSRMAELLPGFLQRGLGSKAMLLATFKGTVAFGYFHPVVCMLVGGLAIYLATEPAHEVESGLVDLELARSVPRHRLVTRSLLLARAAVIVAVGLMSVGTWLGGAGLRRRRVRSAVGRASGSSLLVHLAAVAACLGGFALLVATLSRALDDGVHDRRCSPRSSCTWSTSSRSAGGRCAPIAWISPFHYYPALSIVAGDAPAAGNLVVLFSAAAVFIALAYWQFQRRDL